MSSKPRTTDVARVVRQAISQETKIPEEQLADDEPFERYGIESVMSVAIVRRLEETFGDLSKTLLFEYQTMKALLGYFAEEHDFHGVESAFNAPVSRARTTGAGVAAARGADRYPVKTIVQNAAGSDPVLRTVGSGQLDSVRDPSIDRRGDIAIIGMSGRFPLARNLEEFWANLRQGRDCITEIPEYLWDWRDYWHPEPRTEGKSYAKWGGFIEDADCFDPLFFNISNLAAEAIDPQERVFLETVHHTLEDAGYNRDALRGKRVGLYVAAMWGDYQHYGSLDASTESSFASIANRASYFFDLRGPSIALDTTCSGSLTTVHLACESLRTGETDLAIAGGVNITSHPHKYLALSALGFAATDGRCRSFGADGNGYVPGDGVGALLLKPLATAIGDGDRIHAVIKGTSINHGGRSSGFTVPSAEGQADLIDMALRKADIDPRSITYVEAHAPGTALGDPIEIRGLTNAFRKYTEDIAFCAIGSVKSNIGHLESAAGFAGIAKVVLQMQYQELVPSIHADQLNPNIRFDNTPFYVQRELAAWQPPVIQADGRQTRYPRRAAVSAFGVGGSNAHVILEEYLALLAPRTVSAEHLIVLSAKTEDRLRAIVENLLDYLTRQLASSTMPSRPSPQASLVERIFELIGDVTKIKTAMLDEQDELHDLLTGPTMVDMLMGKLHNEFGVTLDAQSLDSLTIRGLLASVTRCVPSAERSDAELSTLLERIAYTLQIGREPMEHRFATVVQSVPQLQQRLGAYLADGAELELSWTGHISNVAATVATRTEEEAYVARLVTSRRYERLGRLWCNGVAIPWVNLYPDPKPVRIALPLYPFARERCWIAQSATRATESVNQSLSCQQETSAPERLEENTNISVRVPVEHADLRRLVFRPVWSPVVISADTRAQPVEDRRTAGRYLLVYPRSASSLVDALRGLLSPGEAYEIVLGTRTDLVTQRCWEIDVSDQYAMDACLANVDHLDMVYFLGGYHDVDWQPETMAAFKRLEAQSVWTLFRLVKALERLRRAGREMPRLKVVTNHANAVRADDRIQPFTAAVHGLARTVAREHPQLEVEIIDLDLSEVDIAAMGTLRRALSYVVDGITGHREFTVRADQPYVRRLFPYDLEESSRPIFKRGGVYVLIGGAGTIGTGLSRYLASLASARLVWIGRRPRDEAIAAHVTEIERLSGHLDYVQANAADVEQLSRAFDAVERDHGKIDGVLHLAMVHEVTRIWDLSEEQLNSALASKAESTYALYLVLRRRNVGFVTLFSSAEAYVGNVGWGDYAAACCFQDVFALYWAQRAPWPVLSVNWGYWEGIVSDVSNILEAKGVHQLSVATGAAILERALASHTSQVIALDVEDHVLQRMGIVSREAPVLGNDTVVELVASTPLPEVGFVARVADVPTLLATDDGLPTLAAVSEALIDLLSGVLKINRARIEVDTDLINYGIDSLTVVALHKALEGKVGTLPATLFITFQTVDAVAKHLLGQYPAAARALVGVPEPTTARTSQPAPTSGAASLSAKSTEVRLLGRPNLSSTAKYLEQYGTIYRDGRLKQAAASATPRLLSIDIEEGQELMHLLVDTPSYESVELFLMGTGVPVMLLPAVGLTAPTWNYQFTSTLTCKMRLCVPHPPGYGLTKPIKDCTTRGIAGSFKDVIDLIAPRRPVHLVASCLSCVSAIYLARFFPDKIASLTLVGAFHNTEGMIVGDPDRLTTEELTTVLVTAVERVKGDFAGVTKRSANGASTANGASPALLLDSLCANSLIAMRYLTEMLTLSLLDWLPGIRVPTQCIYGTNDKIVAPHHSMTIADAITGAKLVEIDGAGHFPYLTHSEQFNPLLETFVEQHEGARRGLSTAN